MADAVAMELTDEIIAAAAAEVALETPGVYSLLPGITETIQGNILRRAVDAPGVKVSQDDHHVEIDMTLETEYGYNIPSVAWNVQERVKKRVEKIQDLTVDVAAKYGATFLIRGLRNNMDYEYEENEGNKQK